MNISLIASVNLFLRKSRNGFNTINRFNVDEPNYPSIAGNWRLQPTSL